MPLECPARQPFRRAWSRWAVLDEMMQGSALQVTAMARYGAALVYSTLHKY